MIVEELNNGTKEGRCSQGGTYRIRWIRGYKRGKILTRRDGTRYWRRLIWNRRDGIGYRRGLLWNSSDGTRCRRGDKWNRRDGTMYIRGDDQNTGLEVWNYCLGVVEDTNGIGKVCSRNSFGDKWNRRAWIYSQ